MKILMLCFLLIQFHILPQIKKDNISEYLKVMEQLTSNSALYMPENLGSASQGLIETEAMEKYIFSLSEKELTLIVQKKLVAEEGDLFSLDARKNEWSESIKKKGRQIGTGIIGSILQDALKSKYGEFKAYIINMPILIKAKVIDRYTEHYTSTDGIGVPMGKVKIQIEDIIKSPTAIKKGEILEFYYFSFWNNIPANISIGGTYFLALGAVVGDKNRYYLGCNNTFPGMTEIKDNLITDKKNLFGPASMSWDKVKSEMTYFFNNFKGQ